MAFVNEYASDEDIVKFGLNEIWDRYYPLKKGRYFLGRRPELTIDRQKNAFFIVMSVGHGEEGNRLDALLWLNGAEFRADLELLEGSSKTLDAEPFIRNWGIRGYEISGEREIQVEEFLKTLKEALRSYGYWGVRSQRPNTIVKFNF